MSLSDHSRIRGVPKPSQAEPPVDVQLEALKDAANYAFRSRLIANLDCAVIEAMRSARMELDPRYQPHLPQTRDEVIAAVRDAVDAKRFLQSLKMLRPAS